MTLQRILPPLNGSVLNFDNFAEKTIYFCILLGAVGDCKRCVSVSVHETNKTNNSEV